RLSLGAIVEETLPQLEPKARQKNLALRVNIPPHLSWFTDRTALRSILGNLLTNAINYSPNFSAVSIVATRNASSEQLSISNSDSELSPEDVSHLFERFWRKESARSSSGHSGLGLS